MKFSWLISYKMKLNYNFQWHCELTFSSKYSAWLLWMHWATFSIWKTLNEWTENAEWWIMFMPTGVGVDFCLFHIFAIFFVFIFSHLQWKNVEFRTCCCMLSFIVLFNISFVIIHLFGLMFRRNMNWRDKCFLSSFVRVSFWINSCFC